jgi:hypothetical protein
MGLSRTAAAMAAFLFTFPVLAGDAGLPPDVPDSVRQWFRSQRSPGGGYCCDIADGHRTTWRAGKDGGYEVPIAGKWVPVPPEAVIRNAGNPVGEAVVWYVIRDYTDPAGADPGYVHIRCFVPGDGA